MDLFNNKTDKNKNLLPRDGTVNYYGKVLNHQDADRYFQTLLDTGTLLFVPIGIDRYICVP